MKNILFMLSVVLISAFSLPVYGSAGEVPSAKYHEKKISDSVPSIPRTISWAPDGKKIVFISNGVHIHDTENGKQTAVAIKDPFFVSWHKQDEILVLSREGGAGGLSVIDTGTLKVRRLKPESGADAVFPVGDGHRLILLSSKFKVTSIGTDITHRLFVYDMNDGMSKTIYNFNKLHPSKKPDLRQMTGWVHAGMNRLDGSVLVMEHIRPPVVIPYAKVIGVDYLTAETRKVVPDDRKVAYLSGSWSPDGRRIALTNRAGRLEVVGLNGDVSPVDREDYGDYPSWNLHGSQIFAGGYIVNSDGTQRELLLPDSPESIAQWSPSGTKLAVASKSGLRVFEGFSPRFIPPDRPLDLDLPEKLVTLKGLLLEGLLSKEEFRTRYDRLLKLQETGQ